MGSRKTSTSDAESESEFFLEKRIPSYRSQRTWPWVLTTGILSIICTVLLVTKFTAESCPVHHASHSSEGSPPAWRRSDLPAARAVIALQDVQFTGNSAYDDQGRFYVPNPSSINYQGAGAEVDDAWRNLTLAGQRDFVISEEEAKELWPNDYKIHWHHKKQGYSIGLDVFHTLHCIDNLRKYLHPEVYSVNHEHAENARLHQGHCIDQIRQYVMCAGDMTPYGTRWFANPGRNYADSDVTHTCRNFEKLQEWTLNRFHAGGNVHIPGVEVWSPFENGV